MLNPTISIIHDTKNERFHPVLFSERPLPGNSELIRHKSVGHHTEGFETREEALKHITSEMAPKIKDRYQATAEVRTEVDFGWDGKGIPEIVHYFPKQVLQ